MEIQSITSEATTIKNEREREKQEENEGRDIDIQKERQIAIYQDRQIS